LFKAVKGNQQNVALNINHCLIVRHIIR